MSGLRAASLLLEQGLGQRDAPAGAFRAWNGTFIAIAPTPSSVHDSRPWYMAIWAMLDSTMRRWAETLQKLLRMLRMVRALLVLGILIVLASAVLAVLASAGLIQVKWFLAFHAIATLFLLVPLVVLTVLVGLPLRAKSVTRLIDMGYPANFRELAIRVMARKLRDESIETEELLVETAVNETRKMVRRMEESRKRAAAEDAASDPGSPTSPPPPSSPPPF